MMLSLEKGEKTRGQEMGGREGQVKRQHGIALRIRDALEPGYLGSDLSPGPSWPLDLSDELEEEEGGKDGG